MKIGILNLPAFEYLITFRKKHEKSPNIFLSIGLGILPYLSSYRFISSIF